MKEAGDGKGCDENLRSDDYGSSEMVVLRWGMLGKGLSIYDTLIIEHNNIMFPHVALIGPQNGNLIRQFIQIVSRPRRPIGGEEREVGHMGKLTPTGHHALTVQGPGFRRAGV
jgi:hypothetical protein